MPSAFLENSTIDLPKSDKLSPNFDQSVSPRSQEDIPFINSAAESINIVSAKFFAPVIIVVSTFRIPLKNGSKLVAKSDKYVPIVGNPENIPDVKPPIILPINEPIPYPISLNNLIPLFKNSSIAG